MNKSIGTSKLLSVTLCDMHPSTRWSKKHVSGFASSFACIPARTGRTAAARRAGPTHAQETLMQVKGFENRDRLTDTGDTRRQSRQSFNWQIPSEAEVRGLCERAACRVPCRCSGSLTQCCVMGAW